MKREYKKPAIAASAAKLQAVTAFAPVSIILKP